MQIEPDVVFTLIVREQGVVLVWSISSSRGKAADGGVVAMSFRSVAKVQVNITIRTLYHYMNTVHIFMQHAAARVQGIFKGMALWPSVVVACAVSPVATGAYVARQNVRVSCPLQ